MAYRFDSDLRLLGNGFRLAPVFSVVKNAGVLKKRCPCRPLAVGRQGASRLTWSSSHLQGRRYSAARPKASGKTALGDPADKALGEIRRQILFFDDDETGFKILLFPIHVYICVDIFFYASNTSIIFSVDMVFGRLS